MRYHLGYRLSLARNLRLNGISRNACRCNRTVGTVGTKGYKGMEEETYCMVEGRVERRTRGHGMGGYRAYPCTHTSGELHGRAFPCVCAGDATGREAGVKRRVRDTRVMGGARMAFCGQSSMCLYAVMCYRFLARSPAAFDAYARARRYSCFAVLSYAR